MFYLQEGNLKLLLTYSLTDQRIWFSGLQTLYLVPKGNQGFIETFHFSFTLLLETGFFGVCFTLFLRNVQKDILKLPQT